ncbi:acyl-CoA-binding domain-containing protein 6-like [Littorina saxatilis]|uniref:Acyl-CoA-binding domain-containing protein 6 n=1 Tax=Littorina saxatilis TaxID=31220 RepID=A0AAN9G516_9CAEN
MEDVADDFETEESLGDVFKAATIYVRQNGAKFDADKLLYFYARYKQVNEGPCTAPKPGMFDFQGKQKWESWKQLGNMTKTEAMLEYMSLLSNLEPDWQHNHGHGTEDGGTGDDQTLRDRTRSGMGVAVSTMVCPDEQLSDGDKTIFHWCQEGSMDKVKEMLTSGGCSVNRLDEQGIGLLHWASDRGLVDMATMLLDNGADINLQDCEGQTALHYAVSCEHGDIVQLLISRNAEITLADQDGCTPTDVASDDMKTLIQGNYGLG